MCFRRRFLCLMLGLAIVGCQRSDEPTRTEAAGTRLASAPSSSDKSSSPAARKPDAKPKTPPTVAEFKPPFPERTDMFETPKRDNSTVRRDDEHGQTVELKGFIDVDKPRVVLSIDGVTTAVPEGGEKYGVQVISIQPPKVILQRGRNRWPATLE